MRKDQPYPTCNLPIGYFGGGKQPIAVEIYKDGEFVHWFPTVTEAARWLGVRQNSLSKSLIKGHKSKGYEVRKRKSIEETIKSFSNEYKITRQ